MTGCGGGGPDGNPPTDNTVPSVIHWRQDGSYIDGEIMDPAVDLEFYNIYINNTGNFTPNDNVVVQVAAVDAEGNIIDKFDLNLIDSWTLAQNNIDSTLCMYVAMKSVTLMGAQSEFSADILMWGAECYF